MTLAMLSADDKMERVSVNVWHYWMNHRDRGGEGKAVLWVHDVTR